MKDEKRVWQSKQEAHVNEALKGGHVRILAVDDGGHDVAPFQLLGAQIARNWRQRWRLVSSLEQRTQCRTAVAQTQAGHDLVLFQQLRQR